MTRDITPVSLVIAGLLVYSLLVCPFTDYMRNKPIEEKLGFVPSVKLLKPLSVDQKELVGASLAMKVLMYYGGVLDKMQGSKVIAESPDLQGMSRLLHGAVQLDPYNMDAYYFAQGFLTWDAQQFNVANNMLQYGMKYRTWDWYLPFYAGFNYAYFLKDFKKAAEYYSKAGELSGQELHINLAGRYLQESGQTSLAIGYLRAMIATSRNETARKSFGTRLKAFEGVRKIEIARDRFREKQGREPFSVAELFKSGFLEALPSDPYGGQFYLQSDGTVATTSKFAFPQAKKGVK
ncbi:hypothetical protein F6V30_12400 [Oryzomonas sagensis]|uniref:Tetratricopeptide repeat protein n=1 Tax=Oryzomonas sagensis TaxID=2603857 RepID=A0ABQ6TMA5_9BACT|nr:hypothetical protein [Oryzomonas sagensis]KAB0669597.1 hypothetical protein F6V30_12400 [Oryzomonas sagensis]